MTRIKHEDGWVSEDFETDGVHTTRHINPDGVVVYESNRLLYAVSFESLADAMGEQPTGPRE